MTHPPSDHAVGFDDQEIERGRHLFAQSCTFVLSAPSLETLPPPELTEIAFAGRSNVGKSTLVNALTGRKTLARTSNTPGRTQAINFFRLGAVGDPKREAKPNPALMLVDLPGYGYARASKDRVAEWTHLVDAYLKGRASLRRTCLLIDARHGFKDSDRQAMKMFDVAAVSFQAILTKADKLKPADLEACVLRTTKELRGHVAAHPTLLVTSAVTGTGIADTRAALATLAQLA